VNIGAVVNPQIDPAEMLINSVKNEIIDRACFITHSNSTIC